MKKILLKSRFDGLALHQLYNELINHPPINYEIVKNRETKNHPLTKSISKYQNNLYRKFIYHTGGLPYIITQLRETKSDYSNFDLVYAVQHIINTEKPWVTDFEFSTALSGYCDLRFCKNIIAKKLGDKSCKAILPWSEWSKKTLLCAMNCKQFEEKIQVVRFSVHPKKNINIRRNNSKIRILFLGSANIANMLSFEYKGIYETVLAFQKLEKKFDNLELIIRSGVPKELKQLIKNSKNIHLIEKHISKEQLEELFLTTDIFPHPGCETLNVSDLEAMSYGIPVIRPALFNIPESIKNMENGLLLDIPLKENLYGKCSIPKEYSSSYIKTIRKIRPQITEKLVNAMQILIEDESFRKRLGQNAKKTIDEGELSMKKRNDILKKIFDNVTS